MNFEDFKFNEPLVKGLEAMGFKDPTPIQEQAIPYILEGRDIIACAQTGTGKTAAFLLPILQSILANKSDGVTALIIVPTRELAVQIDQQVEGFGYFTGASSIAIYGGGDAMSFEQEKLALSEGADIIIATPGRLISHLNLGYARFETARYLVLDEADRMLDMGFLDDLMKIVAHIPENRKNLLFSATMPPRIRKLASEIADNPAEVSIAISKPAEKIVQAAFMVYDAQKPGLIKHLLSARKMESVIVFCSTKKAVSVVEKELRGMKFLVGGISSDLEQPERETVLRKFKNKEINILVATNIMARGIDIEGIELVINYNVPRDAEEYVHRIGRTARASSDGIAFTFVNEKEQRDFKDIENLIQMDIKKVMLPEHLGEAPVDKPFNNRKNGFKKDGKKPFRGARKKKN